MNTEHAPETITRIADALKVLSRPVITIEMLAELVGTTTNALALRLSRGQMLAGCPKFTIGNRSFFSGLDLVAVDAVQSLANAGMPLAPVHQQVEDLARIRLQQRLSDSTLRDGWAMFAFRNPATGEFETVELYESDQLPETLSGAVLCMSDRRLAFRTTQFLQLHQRAFPAKQPAPGAVSPRTDTHG